MAVQDALSDALCFVSQAEPMVYALDRRRRLDRGRDGLFELRHREPARPEVLLELRSGPGCNVLELRRTQRPG